MTEDFSSISSRTDNFYLTLEDRFLLNINKYLDPIILSPFPLPEDF